MLATEGDWCHEDLPIDLPPWVAPLARAAGLRWQRLTFSYLALRRDGRRLFDEATIGGSPGVPGESRVHLRVVSDNLDSYHFNRLIETGLKHELGKMTGREEAIEPVFSAKELHELHRAFDEQVRFPEAFDRRIQNPSHSRERYRFA